MRIFFNEKCHLRAFLKIPLTSCSLNFFFFLPLCTFHSRNWEDSISSFIGRITHSLAQFKMEAEKLFWRELCTVNCDVSIKFASWNAKHPRVKSACINVIMRTAFTYFSVFCQRSESTIRDLCGRLKPCWAQILDVIWHPKTWRTLGKLRGFELFRKLARHQYFLPHKKEHAAVISWRHFLQMMAY